MKGLAKRLWMLAGCLIRPVLYFAEPAGDPPAGDPPAGDPPAGDPPAGDPPAGDPPAGDPPEEGSLLYGAEGVEVKAPSGLEDVLERLDPLFKESGIKGENASKILQSLAEREASIRQKAEEESNALRKSARDEISKIPVADLMQAKKAVERFFDDEGIRLMQGRAGDNPALVRALVAIGKAMREDSFVEGQGGSGGPKPAESVLYPTMSKE
jgi:hypothetical protein